MVRIDTESDCGCDRLCLTHDTSIISDRGEAAIYRDTRAAVADERTVHTYRVPDA
jgi:hypothetical protein